jgi:hypothetical protein
VVARVLVSALVLTNTSVWSSPDAVDARLTAAQSAWQRTDSAHFEIHYVPALARDVEVAPHRPHRSGIVLPLDLGDPSIDTLIAHELTHLLVVEITDRR